jgi:hypothetical protein
MVELPRRADGPKLECGYPGVKQRPGFEAEGWSHRVQSVSSGALGV